MLIETPTAVRPSVVLRAIEIETPVKPAETPTQTPTGTDSPDGGGGEDDSEIDLDEQVKRIIREIPDPTPQPGGQ